MWAGDSFNFVFKAPKDLKGGLLHNDDPRFLAAVAYKKLIDSGAAQPKDESSEAEGKGDGEAPF